MSWSSPSSDGEVVIEDDVAADTTYMDFSSPAPSALLAEVAATYSALIYDSPARYEGGRFDLSLPRDFLPLSLQAVYGFIVHEHLLEISLVISGSDWRRKPELCDVRHPVLGRSYVGSVLVASVLESFFSASYRPRREYRSQTFLLIPTGQASGRKVGHLVRLGFDKAQASKALIICKDNEQQAATFLLTGDLPPAHTQPIVDYTTCPLLYLVFELADAFLDLPNHCCLCRAPMPPGVKPSVCQKALCAFQASQIGVGMSVVQEIARDPLVADLVVSIFSAAVGTTFLTPAPPDLSQQEIVDILRALPAMSEITARCRSDQDLIGLVGRGKAVELLRWIIISNRSHLISLPADLQLSEFPCRQQFMALLSSPEAEEIFNGIKAKHGSCFLWHGSNGQRWHSIFRNGLKNATGTNLQVNGAAFGPGIYFARNSSTSWGYSCAAQNNYRMSALGAQLQIISLCEVAKISPKETSISIPRKSGANIACTGFLKDHGWAHTLTMEQACVVRFLMVGGSFHVDVLNKPPKEIPTLKHVLERSARTVRA
jgi:poly [ADP-ribose] polymerase 6/8